MRKALAFAGLVISLSVGVATANARQPVPNVVCGGSCDPGAILPPCTSALAGYVAWIVYGNSPTKSQFRCNGRGTWVYEGEVRR